MIPDTLFDTLCCGAKAAIKYAWTQAHIDAGSWEERPTGTAKLPDELDHIFAMAKTGVKDIYNRWSPVLNQNGIALRITGVFCHQTPKAHYKLSGDPREKTVELGDLLVVHEHKDKSGTTRRAVLVQTKMVDNGVPSTVDKNQEYLYENWPDFELKGRGPSGESFLPGPRTLRPGMNAGRYGLIEKEKIPKTNVGLLYLCVQTPWTYSEPVQPIRTAGGEDAGAFIANMLYDTRYQRGQRCVIPVEPLELNNNTPNNHFDLTVEELLTITAKKTLRFRNKPHINGNLRDQSYPICFCQQVFDGNIDLLPTVGKNFVPTSSGGSGDPPDDTLEREYNDGISVLLLETGCQDEARRG